MKPMLCVALCAAACTEDDRVSEFIGTWQYGSDTVETVDCDNKVDLMLPLSGTFSLVAGTTSDLVDASDGDSPCPEVRLDVARDTASLRADESCTVMSGTAPDIITSVISFTDYTIELDSSGNHVALTGRATSSSTGAATYTCVITVAGSATKVDARTAPAPSRWSVHATATWPSTDRASRPPTP